MGVRFGFWFQGFGGSGFSGFGLGFRVLGVRSLDFSCASASVRVQKKKVSEFGCWGVTVPGVEDWNARGNMEL